jgi:hypothetical protein
MYVEVFPKEYPFPRRSSLFLFPIRPSLCAFQLPMTPMTTSITLVPVSPGRSSTPAASSEW